MAKKPTVEEMFEALRADIDSVPLPPIDPFEVADQVLRGGSDD